jgi:hypothetical protein
MSPLERPINSASGSGCFRIFDFQPRLRWPGLVRHVEIADQISKDDCAAAVINNFRARKLLFVDAAQRMSQFIE